MSAGAPGPFERGQIDLAAQPVVVLGGVQLAVGPDPTGAPGSALYLGPIVLAVPLAGVALDRLRAALAGIELPAGVDLPAAPPGTVSDARARLNGSS